MKAQIFFTSKLLLVSLAALCSHCSCTGGKQSLKTGPEQTKDPISLTAKNNDSIKIEEQDIEEQRIRQLEKLISDVMENRVFFEYDKWSITAEGRETLAKVGVILVTNPLAVNINLTVDGHTDSYGTEEYNLALGEKRAQAVREYLLNYGVQPEKIRIRSYGEEATLVHGISKKEQARNRRAEFKARAK